MIHSKNTVERKTAFEGPWVDRRTFAWPDHLSGYDPTKDQNEWRAEAWRRFHIDLEAIENAVIGPKLAGTSYINEKLITAFTGLAYSLATVLANETISSASGGYEASRRFQEAKPTQIGELLGHWRAACTRYSPMMRDRETVITDAWHEVQLHFQGKVLGRAAAQWYASRTPVQGSKESQATSARRVSNTGFRTFGASDRLERVLQKRSEEAVLAKLTEVTSLLGDLARQKNGANANSAISEPTAPTRNKGGRPKSRKRVDGDRIRKLRGETPRSTLAQNCGYSDEKVVRVAEEENLATDAFLVKLCKTHKFKGVSPEDLKIHESHGH